MATVPEDVTGLSGLKNTELKQDINQEDNLGGIYRFNIECKSSGSVHILFKHCLSMFWNFAKYARPENPRGLSLPLLSTGVTITLPSLANQALGIKLGSFIEQSLVIEVCFQLFLFMVILSALLQLEFSDALKHQVYFFINKALTIFFPSEYFFSL